MVLRAPNSSLTFRVACRTGPPGSAWPCWRSMRRPGDSTFGRSLGDSSTMRIRCSTGKRAIRPTRTHPEVPFDDTSPSFSSAWCHGGPGIALSRLRAASLDPELKEDYLDLARIAITSTLKALEEKLNDQTADATPCHGLSGLIEITWIAGQTLNDPSYRVHALEAAQALINLHSSSGDWPSGVPSGGPNPSLMIGTAGIGYTFLRLHATDRVPSVLLIRPGST